jgi:hypothetical protein
LSSQLNTGSNTLVATLSNGTSTSTRTWTITKNVAPTCASQNPAATGSSVAIPSSLNLTATGATTQGLPLSFSWAINGQVPSGSVFNVVSSSTSSLNTFTPTVAYIGNETLVATISDGYDTAQCSWTVNVLPACSIASVSPSSSTPRIAAATGTNNTFTVTPGDASCSVTWALNGSALTGTSNTKQITSDSFNTGNNTLVATVSNGSSTVAQTWTVVKNTPPVCASQLPATSGGVVGVSGTIALTANATDANSDALSFAWTLNGAASPSNFTITGSGNQSVATFAPTASLLGSNTVATTISDGYDTTTCAWNLTVQNNCSFTSSSPSTSTARVAAAASASNAFAVVANDPTCTVSWTVNGSSLNTAATLVNILSSQLNSGANTVVATLSNGTSSATRTWTVTKNTPPVCASQSPNATGATVVTAASLSLTATGTDANSDSLSFAWQVNGQSVASSVLTATSSTSASTATFVPTASYIGTAAITAATPKSSRIP